MGSPRDLAKMGADRPCDKDRRRNRQKPGAIEQASACRRGVWSSSFDKLRMRTIVQAAISENLILSLSKDEVPARR